MNFTKIRRSNVVIGIFVINRLVNSGTDSMEKYVLKPNLTEIVEAILGNIFLFFGQAWIKSAWNFWRKRAELKETATTREWFGKQVSISMIIPRDHITGLPCS
jgi:hypothetical protein